MSTYRYQFTEIERYLQFQNNFWLDVGEILIKPIVNQYHYNPSLITITNWSSTEICICSNIFNHKVKVIYTNTQIIIEFIDQWFNYRLGDSYYVEPKYKYLDIYDHNSQLIGLHPWCYDKGHIPEHLPPPSGDHHATIILTILIPEITTYFWQLWHDHLPPFQSIVDQLCIYIRAFYVYCNVRKGYHRHNIRPRCVDVIINRIDSFAPNKIGSRFDPLVHHRLLTTACLAWKIYLPVRHFTNCLNQITCLPSVGCSYKSSKTKFDLIQQGYQILPI